MNSSRPPLEHFVRRVNLLTLAALLLVLAVQSGSAVYWICSGIGALSAIKRVDYRSSARWWFVLVGYGVIGGVLLLYYSDSWKDSRFPQEGAWLLAGMTACLLTQVALLVTGRIRKVWKFTRPAE